MFPLSVSAVCVPFLSFRGGVVDNKLAGRGFSRFHHLVDTIAALSTPYGVSGIAVVRFSGSECERLVKEIFKHETFEARRTYYGFYRLLSGEPLDEVVWTFFTEGASYTGEPMLEISCHGNPIIVRQLLRDAFQRGCRQAEPGEFTRRAFLNHKIDLCRAEAVADVIHAQSLRALVLAQKQLSGSFSREIENFIQQLTDQIAVVEAYLDFPEEDLPDEDRKRFWEQQSALMQIIERLLRAHEAYVPLRDGIRTVIVGLPNAGKSTLFNRLLGFERAIVSEIPGTTRDFIAETLSLEPYALRLVDTAGLRDTDNDVECLGIEQTREQLEKADLILWVIDGSQPWEEDLEALKAKVPPEKVLILLNKADCGLHPSVAKQFTKASDALRTLKAKDKGTSAITEEERTKWSVFEKEATTLFDSEKKETPSDGFSSFVLSLSLKDKACVPMLRQRLKQFLDERYEDVSDVGFLVHERHAEALQLAHHALQHASMLLEQRNSDDCLAADLKEALRALEAIVGRVDYEQVLDKVFSKFCIGK